MKRMTDRRWGSLLTVLVAALVLPGCGGSGGASGSDSSSPVIASADAICHRLNTELVANVPKQVSLHVFATVSPRNAALERRALDELSQLQPPASVAQQWQQVLSDRRVLADALIELARDAKAGDTTAIQELGKHKEQIRAKLLEAGDRIGFTSCQKLG